MKGNYFSCLVDAEEIRERSSVLLSFTLKKCLIPREVTRRVLKKVSMDKWLVNSVMAVNEHV